jgi:hypothetical protein
MVISRFPALFGKYILLDRVASGGMAEVFRAKAMGAEQFERLVAIKCMLPQLVSDQHFTSMFIDEAKLAAQLNHANIVQIYELGRLKERLYIAMELIQGNDLRHVIQRAASLGIPVPKGFATYVLSKAAGGLDFAHRRAGINGAPLNLVHRDVSPQNILVSYDGEVKMVDFGIAKAEVRATETQAGVLKGKFAYMAPEQIMGEPVDRRADIFALGSVLFETLTGQRLFTGETDISLLENVRSAVLPDLETVLPPNSAELRRILEHTVTRHAADRYNYASEFADDLEALLNEDGVIFGHKRAAAFMQSLYVEEIAGQAEKIRNYAAITAEQCVAILGKEEDLVSDGPAPQPTVSLGSLQMRVQREQAEGGAGTQTPLAIGPAEASPAPAAAPAPGGERRSTTGAYLVQPGEDPYTVMFRPPNKLTKGKGRGNYTSGGSQLPGGGGQIRRAGEHTSESSNPLLARQTQQRKRRIAALASVLMLALLATAGQFLVPGKWALLLQGPQKTASEAVSSPLKGRTSLGAPPAAEPANALPTGPAGYLQLRAASRNRGMVQVDGHSLGMLPLPPLRLSVGRHRIEVKEDGEEARRKSVVIQRHHTQRAPCRLDF